MANKKKGYIPLYRSIQDHWIWDNDEPFSKGQAWIDLLLSANHEEKKINIGMTVVTINPGQMWTSYQKLARKWGWSYKKVVRYISMLKSDGMIGADGTPNGTLITLLNWDDFAIQGKANDRTTDRTDNLPTDLTTDRTTDRQTININNINNDKELNKENAAAPAPPSDGGDWQ